jgi:hypothetical protein
MEQQPTCYICCDVFTTKQRHPIKCMHKDCGKIVCTRCFKQYLLIKENKQECMGCKQPITNEFIFMHTPRKFREQYLNKIVELDLVNEQLLLKATRERAEARKNMQLLRSRISALKTHTDKYKKDSMFVKMVQSFENELLEIKQSIMSKSDEEINKMSNSFYCPMNKCEGIVMNGHCLKCNKHICAKCKEERSNVHECNKELVETINMIKRDTKPCPNCKTPIHKIDGCDQMFCTKCKTAFSWRNLTIQTGIINNPHYDEYMAQINNGNAPFINVNDPCVDHLNIALEEMSRNGNYIDATRKNSTTRAIKKNFFIQRVINEINYILPVLTIKAYDDQSMNESRQRLRENFVHEEMHNIANAYTNWNNQLLLVYKRREMMKDLIKIIELFDRGLKDLIIIGYQKVEYDVMLSNIINLVNYFSSQLRENEKRNGNIKNKTTISIDHGLRCGLVQY